MKIIVAGMRRCGSTLLYNLIRKSYLNTGKSTKGFLWDGDNDDMSFNYDSFDVQVMKRHNAPFTELVNWADKIFVPIRDLRDIIASDIKFGHLLRNEYSILNACAFNVNMFNFWSNRSQLIFPYEDWTKNPIGYINKIHNILDINYYGVQGLYDDLKELSNRESFDGISGFDKESLIFPKHLAGGKVGSYKEFLTNFEIFLIEDHFGDFLIKHNYM